MLGSVLDRLDRPALFWLDGHFSGGITAKGEKETPVMEEIDQILNHRVKGHTILIDDARCFGVDPSYPTIAELESVIRERCSNAKIHVDGDCIRVVLS